MVVDGKLENYKEISHLLTKDVYGCVWVHLCVIFSGSCNILRNFNSAHKHIVRKKSNHYRAILYHTLLLHGLKTGLNACLFLWGLDRIGSQRSNDNISLFLDVAVLQITSSPTDLKWIIAYSVVQQQTDSRPPAPLLSKLPLTTTSVLSGVIHWLVLTIQIHFW